MLFGNRTHCFSWTIELNHLSIKNLDIVVLFFNNMGEHR
jgi:hypothetical protein